MGLDDVICRLRHTADLADANHWRHGGSRRRVSMASGSAARRRQLLRRSDHRRTSRAYRRPLHGQVSRGAGVTWVELLAFCTCSRKLLTFMSGLHVLRYVYVRRHTSRARTQTRTLHTHKHTHTPYARTHRHTPYTHARTPCLSVLTWLLQETSVGSGATYTVGVGSNDLQAALTPGVGVQAVTVHPNFQRATLENDIAILTLSKALTLNDPAVGVARVCLPQAGADVTRFATCHVTGWGATSIQQLATTRWLQTVSVDIQTDQTCSSLYAMTFQSNRFCAGDTVNGSRDSCLGDSGGPLVCSEAGRYVLYGLVSSGVSCANPRFPGIYTEVAAFVPWILQNI
ncbi:serine protease 33-like isoform X1 [Pomacea canaliculata]|uniref:serine protease 33-like isoform X1 n=1 Tax=Pomacea canaliculata TaxID=400727 RepID=UPI000D73A9C0|nr:serine protease 33-like isoform X1 [Pomacea canaliculata]